MTKFYFIPRNVIYYMNLHLTSTIKALQQRFRGETVIYAIRCQINNKVYVGSTLTPARRFHQHLVTGEKSNSNLQADISKYGIDKFTLYVMEIIDVKNIPFKARVNFIRQREQYYMDKFPLEQLYNSSRSYVK